MPGNGDAQGSVSCIRDEFDQISMITARLPYMSRPHAVIELRAWALLAVPNGLLAGAVSGVLVTAVFSGIAPDWALALCVGLVTGAGPLANVSSLAWSHWSRGRDKIAALVWLMGTFAAALVAIAVVPVDTVGLGLMVASVIVSRILWCGIITVRAEIWRANFTRLARTAFVARSQVVVAVIGALIAAGAGYALDLDADRFRWLYSAAAILAVCGIAAFGRMRMRRQRQLLAAERHALSLAPFSIRALFAPLTQDREYRRFLGWLFVLGSGTLMGTAPLILILGQQLAVPRLTQVLITASVPTLMIPLTTPLWAKLLARQHAITYRAMTSYVFVAAAVAALAGATSGWLPLLWLTAVLHGAGYAGGLLGWSLAHNDFAPPSLSTEYLGVHVTLAGVRGLVAPLLGAGTYSALELWQPGLGRWSLAVPLVLVTAGAIGFTRLMRRLAPVIDR